MLADSHTHLYLEDFDADGGGEAAVKRAIDSGVTRLMFPNVSIDTINPLKSLAGKFPENIDMAMGLHPTEVGRNWALDIELIKKELDGDCKYKAIGEIGIDLYWDKTHREQQMQAFKCQCEIAVECNLPVIIHCREGLMEVLDVFESMQKIPNGVFHSFGGTEDDVTRIRQYGDFYFGINGIVTFKKSKLPDVLPHIGPERILLETDSPYLSPVPHRGKRNESAYMVHTAAFVASTLNIPLEELQRITTDNYHRLFENGQ